MLQNSGKLVKNRTVKGYNNFQVHLRAGDIQHRARATVEWFRLKCIG